MKISVAFLAKPVYKPWIWIKFVMNLSFWVAAILARFTLYLTAFYEHVGVSAADTLYSLLFAGWMSLAPFAHVSRLAWVAVSAFWRAVWRVLWRAYPRMFFQRFHVTCYVEQNG
jgi:hypothetical protein